MFVVFEFGEYLFGGKVMLWKSFKNKNVFFYLLGNMGFEKEFFFKVGNGFFRKLWVFFFLLIKLLDGLGF